MIGCSFFAAAPLLTPIIQIGVYVLPFVFIPFVFRAAGGAFSTLTGMVNDKSKGLFDRAKKRRADKLERTASGNYFKKGTSTNFRGKINRGFQSATLLPQAGLDPRKMRTKMNLARNRNSYDAAQKFLEENSAARAIKGDDDKLWAVMNADNEAQVRKELLNRAPDRFHNPVDLNNAVQEVMAFKHGAGQDVTRIAATLAQAGTGTGFNYREDGVDDDMMTAVIRASGSDRGLSGRMLAGMRESLKQSGRIDLGGGGFAKQATIMDKLRTSMGNGGVIEQKDENGVMQRVQYGLKEAQEELHKDVLASNAGAVIAGKLQAIKNIAPTVTKTTDQALTSGDTQEAARALADIAGKYDAAAAVAPQNAAAWADNVMTHKISVASLPESVRTMLGGAIRSPIDGATKGEITYQDAIEALRSNPQFTATRRELAGQAAMSAEQQRAQQAPGTIPTAGNFSPPSF